MSTKNEITETDKTYSQEATGLAFIVGFYFSFRMIFVLFSVRVLGTDPRAGTELSLALSVLLFGLVCFQSLGYVTRSLRSMIAHTSIRWVIAFLVFSLCSLAWSDTVSLSNSIINWCWLVSDVAMITLLLRSGSVIGVSHAVMRGFVVSTCCLAVIAWLMPVQADLRLGDEEFFNTNQIANLCVFAIFIIQYLRHRKDGRWLLATLLLTITLLRSLSKTTIVAFLVGESFVIIQDKSLSRKSKMLLTILSISAVLIFWGLFEAYLDIYTSTGNQAETLTGRTAIWAYVLNAALERPWIGHGFDSMWKVIPPFGPDRFEAKHAENELLQQFYVYGVAGVVILVGIYGSLYRQISRIPRSSIRIVFIGIMLFVIVRGTAEAEPFDLLLPLWLIVLFSFLVNQHSAADGKAVTTAPAIRLDVLDGTTQVFPLGQ